MELLFDYLAEEIKLKCLTLLLQFDSATTVISPALKKKIRSKCDSDETIKKIW